MADRVIYQGFYQGFAVPQADAVPDQEYAPSSHDQDEGLSEGCVVSNRRAGALVGVERRVLIIVQNLPVPFDRRVWLECQALVSAGYRVAVVCPKGKGDPSYQVVDGVEHLQVPTLRARRQQAELRRRVCLLVPGDGLADAEG